MNVLHITDYYLPHGQNWIYPQIVNVPGTTTAVLCRDGSQAEAYPLEGRPLFCENPPVPWADRFGRMGRVGVRWICTASARARALTWRPHVMHAHFGNLGWQSLPLKRLLKVPLITTFYGADAWSLPVISPWHKRYERLFSEGDLFLVEGPAMRERMIEIGCPPEKLKIRHLGVDLNNVCFTLPDFRKGLSIAMVARFVPKKGFVDGLRACFSAASAGVDLRVTIIGDAFGDEEGQAIKRELIALAETSPLKGRVYFTGFLPLQEMHSVLSTKNVILCPSKRAPNGDTEGGMPFVLAEAMAMGLLGIGSRHCDMTELIDHGRTGFLFAEGAVEELAAILIGLPQQFEEATELALQGRRHIEIEFDLQRQLSQLSSIYQSNF